MKQYIAILPMLDEEKNKLHRPAHLVYLAELERKGSIYLKARFVDGVGGMVIYNAQSLEEAEQLAYQDPLVIHGARSCEFHELLIV
ncbi:YciI family protein [Paenibacillus qinlingensis]|uniref:Uncharacterized protein YciI n=1 Tax=Paenibacillus qinlingensis TaxID=1837343 RepID=A0ABU1P0B7_9BACL|nr:YciI family protein [Paenibacillus qinlingensis]MDR6553198.1 uncharacterized protein YciI [Paenibacillus qinlingensis]